MIKIFYDNRTELHLKPDKILSWLSQNAPEEIVQSYIGQIEQINKSFLERNKTLMEEMNKISLNQEFRNLAESRGNRIKKLQDSLLGKNKIIKELNELIKNSNGSRILLNEQKGIK